MSESLPKSSEGPGPESGMEKFHAIISRLGAESRQVMAERGPATDPEAELSPELLKKITDFKKETEAFFAVYRTISRDLGDRLVVFLGEIHDQEGRGELPKGAYAAARKELVPLIDRSTAIGLENKKRRDAVESTRRIARKEELRKRWGEK